MTPEAAFQEQIKLYQQMTGEQRLAIALDMRETDCNLARERIHRLHPDADASKVEQLLHEWIATQRESKPCALSR
jgi:hypothetical protein